MDRNTSSGPTPWDFARLCWDYRHAHCYSQSLLAKMTACPSEELDPAGTSDSMNVRLTEQKSTLFQWFAVPL